MRYPLAVLLLLSSFSFAWWDASFQYRMPVTLANGGSTLSDYQVLVTVNTASLVSAGKMRSDCADMRFAGSSDAALSFWLESGCNSASTKVWVKDSSVPGRPVSFMLSG